MASHVTQRQPAFPMVQAAALLSAASLVLLGVAWWVVPLVAEAAEPTIAPIHFAAVTVWATALVGLSPVALLGRHGVMATVYGCFIGMGLRLALCFGATMVAVHGKYLPGRPTATALATFYLPLLMIEAALVGRYLWRKDALLRSNAAREGNGTGTEALA